MPIKDYNDDAAMAKLGRETARRSAAKKLREELRNRFVRIESCPSSDGVKAQLDEFVAIANELIEALELE